MTFLRPVRLVIALIPLVVVVCGMPPQDVTTRRYNGHYTQHYTYEIGEFKPLIQNFVNNSLGDLNAPRKILKRPANKTETATKIKKRVTTVKPPPATKVKKPPKKKKRPTGDVQKIANYTKKTTVHKVISKWSDRPYYNDIKQNFYDYNSPLPTPNPEISSNSPQFAISNALPVSIDTSEVTPSNLDLLPGSGLQPMTYTIGNSNPNCPSVHISGSVVSPYRQARQDCADYNIVINSHLHQNAIRAPEVGNQAPVETAPAVEPVESPPLADVPAEPVPADPPAVQAAPPAAPASGGSGGGFPSLPELPMLPELPELPQLPDLANLFRLGRTLWQGLRGIFGFLANPYFYLIPAGLSFLFGFGSVLSVVPWWAPVAYWFGSQPEPPPEEEEIFVHNYVHKPVHHPDGWFFNHNTKTWTNVEEYLNPRSIENFAQNWKNRKK